MIVNDYKNQIILGIGDYAVDDNVDKIIKTYALGSCVAVVIYNPANHRGGMVHVALSSSSIDPEKGTKLPGYFADTGIPVLSKLMRKGDPLYLPSNMIVYLIGGASMPMMEDYFSIGKNNVQEARSILDKMGYIITKEDVGDKLSRTVALDISSGKVIVSNARVGQWEL